MDLNNREEDMATLLSTAGISLAPKEVFNALNSFHKVKE
jgi:hypothetical protein